MQAYWRRVVACGRDMQLFLVYALLSYLGIGILALIFNLYLVELGYDEAFVGAFNGVFTLSMGLTCLGVGFLINRFGNWACIVWGTVEFALTTLALSLVTSEPALLVFGALNGIGSAFIVTNQMPFVIEWTPKPHTAGIAALSSALNSASIMIGSLAGGLIPGLVAALAGVGAGGATAYRWTLAAGAALTAASLAPMLLMTDARRQRHHEEFRVAHARLLSHRVRRQARRDVIALVLLGLFLAFGVGAIEPFYNVLLQDMGTPASTIGLIFALSGLVTTVVSLAGPAVANRIGLVAAQVWIRLVHVPIHLALIPFPSAAIVSLAYGARRVSGSMAWPLESAHVGGLLPPAARAHAFGLRSASWNIGFAIAAFLSGQVIASTGSYTPAYIAVGIFCVLSVLVYVVAYGGRVPENVEHEPRIETPAAADDLRAAESPVVTG
jgi:MFS family permease